jgi:hypothetical protein
MEGFRTRETVFSGKNKKKFGKNKERPIDATSKASGRGDAPRAMTSKYTSLSVGAMFGEAWAGVGAVKTRVFGRAAARAEE